MCRRCADDVQMTREWEFVGDLTYVVRNVVRNVVCTCARRPHIVCRPSHADDVRMTWEWDSRWDFTGRWHMLSGCHLHIICTLAWVAQFHAVLHLVSSECRLHIILTLSGDTNLIHTSSAGMYIIHMWSAGTYVIRTSSAEFLMVRVDLNYLSTVTGTGYWMEFVTTILSCSFQDHVNNLRHNLCWWFSLHVASGHCSYVICICTCHPHIIWAYAYYVHIICSGPWYIPS